MEERDINSRTHTDTPQRLTSPNPNPTPNTLPAHIAAGHRDAPISVSGTPIYFRGRDILDNAIDYLLSKHGMAQAKIVIVKGCSAGGLATILNTDYARARISAAVPGVTVIGLPDAGYFLDANNTAGQPSYTPLYEYVAQMQNATAAMSPACLASYPAAEQWKCFMAQYAAPFVQTPLFFAQDLDDSWQMSNILQLGCSPSAGKPGNCNAAQMQALYTYRNTTLNALKPVFSSSIHGGFFTDCVQHCHTNIQMCYTNATSQGQTMQETFWAWYQKTVQGVPPPANVLTTVIDGTYGTNPTCTSACSPY